MRLVSRAAAARKTLGDGRHRQRRGVVLGQVIAVEAGGLGRLQQGQAILEGLLERLAAIVDVIEDAEFHVASFRLG